MGPAVLQRDALHVAWHGRDLPAGMGAILGRRHPKSLSFPPFYSLHRSPLAVQTLLEVQDAAVPTQGLAGDGGLPNCKAEVLILGQILTFIPHLVLSVGPSGGSCLHHRKETGEKPPGTKERMQEPARKELYWHDPTGSLRHPHRPGCEPRGRDGPKYLQNPSAAAKRRPREPRLLSVFPRAPFQR